MDMHHVPSDVWELHPRVQTAPRRQQRRRRHTSTRPDTHTHTHTHTPLPLASVCTGHLTDRLSRGAAGAATLARI
eukprot:347468-Chlamydomonas_euryale.AAC.4